jgi:hypothetical protein
MTVPVLKPEQSVTKPPDRASWLGPLLVSRVAAYWRQRRVPDVIALPDQTKERAIDQDHH